MIAVGRSALCREYGDSKQVSAQGGEPNVLLKGRKVHQHHQFE